MKKQHRKSEPDRACSRYEYQQLVHCLPAIKNEADRVKSIPTLIDSR